jgi:hypothetical protein
MPYAISSYLPRDQARRGPDSAQRTGKEKGGVVGACGELEERGQRARPLVVLERHQHQRKRKLLD